ncbi:IS200/IS605 family transposase, partial [Clostridium botulinum]|nr:IS200/IS605 family transposase [Clostridium botulinum]
RNKKIIEEYIKNQIQEDIAYEQMSLKEYIDPFTGEPVNKSKNKYLLGAAGESMRWANRSVCE